MKKISLFIFIFIPVILFSQNVSISADASLPHTNAMLDVKGVNKGMLIPRGDATTRTVLATNSAKGLMLYDTVTNSIWIHNGNGLASGWQAVANGNNYWTQNGALGTEIRNINNSGIWSSNSSTVISNPGVINPPVNGSGTRFMWIPQKSAFRAGTVAGQEWNADSIGTWSFAVGFANTARGAYTFIGGFNNRAWGSASTALGIGNLASGPYSLATGQYDTASGESSFATGQMNRSVGDNSASFGFNNQAVGDYSMVTGFNSRALGYTSFVHGYAGLARGGWSFVTGNSNTAGGNMAQAHGYYSNARAFASTAFGQYNDSVSTSSPEFWFGNDPLLYVGNGTSDANRHNAMVIYKNGNVVMKNPVPATNPTTGFTAPVQGGGTRLMWLPEKSAFRAGTVENIISTVNFEGNYWNTDSIGTFSFAAGYNTKAKGTYSTAIGNGAIATGHNGMAIGVGVMATGFGSIAMGFQSEASGFAGASFGYFNSASGPYSTAFGQLTNATGEASFSSGIYTVASGNFSTAIGNRTESRPFASLSMGQWNETFPAASTTTWIATDPLLILGNGASSGSRSNAMVVYKNGNTDIGGFTQLGKTSELAPSIKMKKMTATSPSTQGGVLVIPHGLTRSKILGVQILLTYVANTADIPPSYLDVLGYEYNWQINNTELQIYNKPGNSVNILSKPVRILITYEE